MLSGRIATFVLMAIFTALFFGVVRRLGAGRALSTGIALLVPFRIVLGTRWGDQDAKFIPAPGDPFYLNYSYNPLGVGVAPPPPENANLAAGLPPEQAPPSGPMPAVSEPLVPMVPPATAAPVTTASQIFAGPYGAEAPAPPVPAAPPDEVPPAPGGGG